MVGYTSRSSVDYTMLQGDRKIACHEKRVYSERVLVINILPYAY